jgi:hypothetical protein
VGVIGFGPPSEGPGAGAPVAPAAPAILSAPKKVKAGKKIALKLRCETGCTLALNLKIGKKAIKGLKPVKIAAGLTAFNLKLPSKPAKKVKAALKKSKQTRIVLAITPSSAEGTGAATRVSIVR